MTFTKRSSVFGATLFKFIHEISFCYDGTKITSIYNQRNYVTNIDSFWRLDGPSTQWNQYDQPAHSSMTAYATQPMLGACAFGVCDRSYPWIKIKANANGTYTYTSGS